MKTEPAPLPHGHGVYALVHTPTQRVYIGSSTDLRNRAYEWAAALKGRRKPLHFEVGDPDDWVMKILKRTEGMTHQELRDLEAKAITRARDKGMQVLNQQAPASKAVYTVDGLTGSATFHATRLGKTPSHVVDKLHRNYTIEQALGLAPAPEYDHSIYLNSEEARQHAISMMPVKITHEGKDITYAEAAAHVSRSVGGIRESLKRRRRRDPELKTLELDDLRT